ncbi:MAG: SufS family cysteine desulfurase [Candidatus Heimdallarchaeota archaeon]|nr:SufS family cysteine desulfurase [Candidatus Heimdallarchaeota archaeon]
MKSIDETIEKIRKDFPILKRKVRNKPLVYFDNGATTQKPQSVIDTITDYYTYFNANVHRGIHTLSEEASEKFEVAHQKTADFVGSKFEEMIFTKNTTESINTVVFGLEDQLKKGDEIVLSRFEHHANLVPFQQIAKKTGAIIKFMELQNFENIDMNSAETVITDKTKIVSFPHMSNVLGSILPVKELTNLAHDHGALVHLDGAQSVPNIKINVKELDIDFMSFSGHKMMAPMGTGGLYGKEEILENLHPFLFGGDMIYSVTYDDAKWNDLPWKFEAGTPNVGASLGLGAAVDYLNNVGMDNVRQIEHHLTKYALKRMEELDFITVYGPKSGDRGAVISFNLTGAEGERFTHPHDVASLLDEEGIAVRAGHHCAQPLVTSMGLPATTRMSFYIYNTTAEIDFAIDKLIEINKVFN